MANQRLSKDKQALVIAALCEGTPINAICRMFSVGKHAVLRVIEETGEALANHMYTNFRGLAVKRLELDEQWQYVGVHGQRMTKEQKKTDRKRGDFWLWCGIDADTKLVVGYHIGRRDWQASEDFVCDLSKRVVGPVQIATDQHRSYERHIKAFFNYDGYSYGTETKIFGEPYSFNPDKWNDQRKNGIAPVVTADREAVVGSPDLGSLTTSHIERCFLTVRQQLKRFQRQGLGYSKDLRMHKLAVALHFGFYNLVRKHTTLGGKTPAMAAGLEAKPWTLTDVVNHTEAYWAPKIAAEKQAKAAAHRMAEDAGFQKALTEAHKN